MKLSTSGKVAQIAFLFTILVVSTVSISLGLQSTESVITGHGSIIYWPRVDVNINLGKVIGTNNLYLGFQLASGSTVKFYDDTQYQDIAKDAKFKLVRIFDYEFGYGPGPNHPCTYWNEASKTGTFDWTHVDALVEAIFAVGAEPLITLGDCDSDGLTDIPSGMALDPATGLAYPDTWGAYCTKWVKHFKQTGKHVRFYEIINEPWMYYKWDDWGKMENMVALYNVARPAMKAEDPNILVGFNADNRKNVIDYWLDPSFKVPHEVGADLDFISFHKYDSSYIGAYTDAEMFNRAETHKIMENGWYSPKDVQQVYLNARGKLIPIINSESNFNSVWISGTDPKIQQMAGAVWTALVLRTFVLEGMSYSVYFTLCSSASWERANKASGGVGFGMINSDNKQPWYPYYVQWIIGNGLSVSDSIIESVSSSNEIRVLSWIHEGKSNIFLICKVDQPRTIILHGISGQLNISKIDNTISWETPSLQTSVVNSTDPLTVNGYTVMWLQSL